jgi:DNA-binding winged helix-turn-helix (wHTH) protein
MSQYRTNGVDRHHQRRWSFANCTFDEADWALMVAGRRVPVEIKPLELLRALLRRAGNVVSKEELLDAVWPDVEVVEASLTTAIRKLRGALDDDRRRVHIIQTVPRIGYRLAVPVKVEETGTSPDPSASAVPPMRSNEKLAPLAPVAAAGKPGRMPLFMTLAGALAIIVAAITVAVGPTKEASPARMGRAYGHQEVAEAIRKLDIDSVERMLAAGWDPNTPWDKQGNDAFTALLDHCEWDRGHDRRKMLLMARTLIEGGLKIDHRNVYGDTPYSIAKAPRFCGPDHPVTQMLEAMCYGGDMGPKDLCLATYELTAEQRRAQGLPPKAS